ncbi:hypothetical protein N7481_000301 [Penicillium waksmanii]|uniref:uncharacterized protein n=1 Tax=Penicillium waksmanii TaxID=69791 RepID=UPI002548C8E4|nr:uncharacterized protein N7481_000301 [Penicillium waksmanii]KAJ5999892.1 hypothetical protein N7481_000301 [Penicillium waksmanii]
MMEYLLRPKLRYPAIQDSLEVAEALEIVLSKADTATLVLLLERQLVGNLVSIDEKCVMALVSKRNGDLPKTAIAATLDMLMEHSIAMEIKDLHKSPLHDLYAFHDRIDLFQLLLDRRADPLRKSGKSGKGDTPLVHVSETGSKELVRMMFKSLDTRNDIPLEKLKTELERAEYMATWGLEKRAKTDVRPLLRRYYWRKKYQNMSTAINTVSSKTQQEEPKKESKKESKKGKLEAQKEKRRERRARRRRKAKIKDEVLFWDPKSLVQLLNVIRD